MWLTRVPNTESVVKTSTFERGSYYFFDPTVWETTRKVGPIASSSCKDALPYLLAAMETKSCRNGISRTASWSWAAAEYVESGFSSRGLAGCRASARLAFLRLPRHAAVDSDLVQTGMEGFGGFVAFKQVVDVVSK